MISRIFLIIILLLKPSISSAYQLDQMVSDLIIEKLAMGISELEINYDNKSKSQIPTLKEKGVKSVRLTYFEPNYSSFRINVTARDDQMFDIFGRYRAFMDVPVLSKGIASGTIITEADIVSVKTPYSKVKSGYMTSLGDIVGLQARRNLAGGSYIRKNDIVKPQIIKNGDDVSIIYDQGNIKLRTNGTAQQSGAMGDNIKVKNATTSTVVNGIVKGKNLVEVGK